MSTNGKTKEKMSTTMMRNCVADGYTDIQCDDDFKQRRRSAVVDLFNEWKLTLPELTAESTSAVAARNSADCIITSTVSE